MTETDQCNFFIFVPSGLLWHRYTNPSTHSCAKFMTLRVNCLKLFQLITIPLFSIAYSWSIMFPNITARPDTSIHEVQGQLAAFVRLVWEVEKIPIHLVAKGSCEEAKNYTILWTTWRWRSRTPSNIFVYVHTETIHTHTAFSYLVSLNESEFIYNSHHSESWLLWPASAILLEIRAKLHTCKDIENP